MTLLTIEPTLFSLDREGNQIYISDLQSQTQSTFAYVDFDRRKSRIMIQDIMDKCIERSKDDHPR